MISPSVQSDCVHTGPVSSDTGFLLVEHEMIPLACKISLNDAVRTVVTGMTVEQLLADMKLQPRVLAVELNRRVVPRADHATTRLADGDRVEIVTLVGGG